MANDTRLNSGSGGDLIRSIEKSGVKTQVVTLDIGGSGSELLTRDYIPIISAEHVNIHKGITFRYSDSLTLGSAATQDYLFTTPDSTTAPHITFVADGNTVTTFEMFEATDKTGTTLQTVFNADRNSATASTCAIHKGTSGGTTDGTKIISYSSGFSGSGQGGSRQASAETFDGEWILKRNTKYIFRITSGAADNRCNVYCGWYELT